MTLQYLVLYVLHTANADDSELCTRGQFSSQQEIKVCILDLTFQSLDFFGSAPASSSSLRQGCQP